MNDKVNDTLGYSLPEEKFEDEIDVISGAKDAAILFSRSYPDGGIFIERLGFGTLTPDDGVGATICGDVYTWK